MDEARKEAQLHREELRGKYLDELTRRSDNYRKFLKDQTNGEHNVTLQMDADGVVKFPYDLKDEGNQFLLHMICAVGQKDGPLLSMVIETDESSFNETVKYPQIDLKTMTFCGTEIMPVESLKKSPMNTTNGTAFHRDVGLCGENTTFPNAIPMTFQNLLSQSQIDAIHEHADKGMMPKSWVTVVKAGEEGAFSIREWQPDDDGRSVFFANSQNNKSENVTFAQVHDNLIATVNFINGKSLIDVAMAQENAHKILHNLNFKFNFCTVDGNPLTLKNTIINNKPKTTPVQFRFSNLKEALFAKRVPIYSIAYKKADEELDAEEAEEEETSEALGYWSTLIENATPAPFDTNSGVLKVKARMTKTLIDQVIHHQGFFESLCDTKNPTQIFDFLIGDNGKTFPFMHQVAIFFSNCISMYAIQTKDQTGHLSNREVTNESHCYATYLNRTKKHGVEAHSSVGYELKVIDFFVRIIILAVYGKKFHIDKPTEYEKITSHLTHYNEVFAGNKGVDPLLSVQEILLLIPAATLKSIIRDFKKGILEKSAMKDAWMKDNIQTIEETIESFNSSTTHPSSYNTHKAASKDEFIPEYVSSAPYLGFDSSAKLPTVAASAAGHMNAGGHNDDEYL